MVRAVVLAAGASSRMGRPKAELAIGSGGETFLSRIVRTCVAAGLPDIVVVTGAHDAQTRAALPAAFRAVRVVHNPNWAAGQLTSLLSGIGEADDPLLEGVLMTLVDAPYSTPDVYARVLRAWRASRAAIVRPARGDEHGHPVIFDRAVFDDLRHADPAIGAKVVVRARAADILNVPVEAAGAFVDVDTPEDYARSMARGIGDVAGH